LRGCFTHRLRDLRALDPPERVKLGAQSIRTFYGDVL
jgi:hypothetical protein